MKFLSLTAVEMVKVTDTFQYSQEQKNCQSDEISVSVPMA